MGVMSFHKTTGKPHMSFAEQPSAAPSFRDRSAGLVAFGVIQILMGIFCVMMIPFMLLSVVVGPAAGAATDVWTMIPAAGFYAVLAVAALWLGIGSILARRWARALTLVLAWMVLVMGIVTMILMGIWMPGIMAEAAAQDPRLPPEAMIIMQVVMLGTMGCMYLVMPGAFVAFYRSPHVKATCEFRDPHVRWTDKCPLPVLALSLMLGFGAVSMVFTLGYGAIPFFGVILKGVPAVVVILGFILLFAYLAWAVYKLKMSAWVTTLLVYVLFGLSTIVTFSRVKMVDYYREIGLPEEQIEMVQRSGMLSRMNIPVMIGVGFVVIIAYMLWVRRYFVARSETQLDS
ncbi:MAG: hypothetical protein GXX96_25075 [Planctomycetaceae bacterium]|jgi:hypothetical protein|nr:hypothetical protein [Planctomycetaceae bacterium]